MGDDPAVLQRVGRFETQHHHRRFVRRAQAFEHFDHRDRRDERRIAKQHDDVAIEILERVLRLRHRMAGPQLRFLHHAGRAVGHLLFHLFAFVPHDHDGPARLEDRDLCHQMLDNRAARDIVQDLVHPALEARTLARGENDDSEITALLHGQGPCHQSLAV